MTLDRRWLLFQVGLPLVAPAGLSFAFVAAWQTLDGGFMPDWRVIVDISPWALAVYSLTLIGTTFDRAWSRLDRATVSQLCASAAVTSIYYAMLVIKRHDVEFVVRWEAYFMSLVLMVVSIVICYRTR